MIYNEYKKIALSMLAKIPKDKPRFIAISSSCDGLDSYEVAVNIALALSSMQIPSTVINANVKNELSVALSDSFDSFPLVKERSFKLTHNASLTPHSAAAAISGVDSGICLVSIDKLTEYTPAMYFAACCGGIILAEKLKKSRTDEIDRVIDTATSLNVPVMGFITIK